MTIDGLVTFINKGESNYENVPLTDENINNNFNVLKNAIESLIDVFYPIGSFYETTDTEFDPNTSWTGTWELDTSGTVLVSKSSDENSIFYADVGTVVGEETHTMLEEELASHTHTFTGTSATTSSTGAHTHSLTYGDYGVSSGTYGVASNASGSGGAVTMGSAGAHTHTLTAEGTNSSTGSSTPFNIVQPSTIVTRWHRTA